jgi:hypothetical protein
MEDMEAEKLRLAAAEDQWEARWGPNATPHTLDLRPVVWEMDRVIRRAAHYLELGVALSPQSVQMLENALGVFKLGKAMDRGEIPPDAYDAYVRWSSGVDSPPDH